MAFFVAFYSYKGGVGRTLALANVGYSLAARGKRVVLVDMDLEAPALHGFAEFALYGGRPEKKKGVVDYTASYSRRGRCPAIKRYVHACRKSPGSGKLWLMPGGQFSGRYQETLGELNWRRLHPKKGTDPFVEGLRQALIDELKPDYVLIDSRTGFSDVGGLSTHFLADMVVLVFNLTKNCLEGSVRAYRSFTAEGSRLQAVQLVASPVPPLVPGTSSLVKKRLDQAKALMPQGVALGRKLLRVDYDPAMVLAEDLAVRKPDDLRAAAVYERLREAVQRANKREVLPVVERAQAQRSQGRLDEGRKLLEEFVATFPENAEGHFELGNFLIEVGRTAEACERYEEAVRRKPGYHEALFKWGTALGHLAEMAEGDERRELLERECDRYDEALRQVGHKKKKKEKEKETKKGPYIETEFCTTCDVCTDLYPRMFAYNDKRQAYIRKSYLENPTTGRYTDLVRAAAQCPLRIIHPGLPLDPHEPNLEKWIELAERFNRP